MPAAGWSVRCHGMYTVLPLPRGPSMSRLCEPEAAMISARFAIS